MVTVDLDKVKSAAPSLKANSPKHDDIPKDPMAFLAAHGITLDAKIEQMITAHKSKGVAATSRQGAIVHIDA